MAVEQEMAEAAILIIDDQPMIVRLIESMLKSGGCSMVRSTTDPRDVATLWHEFQPDIVLLDLYMPHVDGFHVMEQIKPLTDQNDVPVLVLTEDSSDATRRRALAAGARGLLTKPFNRNDLILHVSRLLRQRLLSKQSHAGERAGGFSPAEPPAHFGQVDALYYLGHAIESLDDITGMHTMRMSRFCARLGQAAGFSAVDGDLLLQASRLHDIGKVAIPDSILMKPGALDPDEFEIVKAHTTIGARMLAGGGTPMMQMAETIALTHHEKWDGSEYPHGRRGEEIPLVGRIVAVCDVFDILTVDRPYRRAWPVEDGLAELERQSGICFDPQLVQLFRAVLSDILAIKRDCRPQTAPAAGVRAAG